MGEATRGVEEGLGKRGRKEKRRGRSKSQKGRDKEEKILKVLDTVAKLFPESPWTESELREVIEEAYEMSDEDFREQAAADWGRGFAWPDDVGLRDESLAEEHGFDIERMARAHQASRASERLSRERIEEWVPAEDPDRQRLLSLAEGMAVLTSDNFEPAGDPPRMRALYLKVKNAVNKMLFEIWEEGLAFIVTKDTADKMAALHGPWQYNAVSWAPKKGKPQGRHICDSSDPSAGVALNSEEAARKLESMYGPIEHPTLDDLVQMINDFVDQAQEELGDDFRWEDVRLWKADLRKALV
jgi:hypothetical protein